MRQAVSGERSSHFWLAVAVATAVGLRVLVALLLGDGVRALPGAADEVSYDMLAQRLVGGFGFTFPRRWYPFTEAGEPTAHWSYLYTLYLAAVYALCGHHPVVARLVQALASGLGVWMIGRIGTRLFDARGGAVAAALAALYAYFLFFAAVLMTQTFFTVALLVAVERALALRNRESRGAWIGLGLALGVGAVLRQTLLLFAPLLIAWCWLRGVRGAWRGAVLASLCTAAMVLPWTAYNYATFGDFLLLNSNGGLFFYASNHPDQGVDFDPDFVPRLPEEIQRLSEPAADRALFRGALRFIADDPWRFARLSVDRLGHFFWLLPSSRSSLLSNVARLSSFTLYLPFVLYGMWRTRRRWRELVPIYAYLVFEATLHVTSWAAPRYRLPSDALAMVIAAQGVLAGAVRFGWTTDGAAAPPNSKIQIPDSEAEGQGVG